MVSHISILQWVIPGPEDAAFGLFKAIFDSLIITVYAKNRLQF